MMEQFFEIDGFCVNINQKSVFAIIDCYEDSPVYEAIVDEYEEIHEEMLALAKPVGILGFGRLPKELETEEYKENTPVIYAFTSIGNGIKERSTQAFDDGDYVKGMLCDAMADDALFSMEERLIEVLTEVCRARHVGIRRRLEAPQDIPMIAQRIAWEYLELEKRFGIGITEGFMLDPVKSSCQIFILTEDEKTFRASHDCRKCARLDCKMRNIPPTEITVKRGSESRTVTLIDGESLMDLLLREGYYISAVCGGRGRCGKCGVQILEGFCQPSAADRAFYQPEELKAGWRLSCECYPTDDLVVAFDLADESEIVVPDLEEEPQGTGNCAGDAADAAADGTAASYQAAIDIGTTTIAIQLYEEGREAPVHTVTMINGQRTFGADVITRIQASVEGKKEQLQKIIRTDLIRGLEKLMGEAQVHPDRLKKIVIACNTTMSHLLMGYPCDSLGVYPFTPVNIGLIRGTSEEILGSSSLDAEVVILPGISTYVGGDITAGLYACGFAQNGEISLLIDLGTNGEMAIGNRERILTTSTAAGPAFEGGNISWGTGSIPGAICSVTIEEETAHVSTIQNKTATGICGTGVVEAVSELVKEGLVDETGLLDEDYFDDGFPLAKTADGQTIVFTQKDVREIQLAKAAIRAGIETLTARYGITKEKIGTVYLAGGFGFKLDCEKAIAIGMLPEEFRDRVRAIGNSSLQGAARFLKDPDGESVLLGLAAISEEIALSTDPDFNAWYMDSMMFEEEKI